ncbi:hypothetical protein B6V70_25295 [Escherichia coli]|nr:hypothetical protein [Escherichia coli]
MRPEPLSRYVSSVARLCSLRTVARCPADLNGFCDNRKRTARAVLTGMCYSAGSAMRHGSSSLTRLTGQSAMTPSTWRR